MKIPTRALAARACLAAAALAAWVVASARAGAEVGAVFAAASLGKALDAAGADFRGATGYELSLVYAGSSALARQILHGAPADLFISADQRWMDRLEAEGMIEAGSRFNLVGNRLALVSRPPAPELTLADAGAGALAAALGDGYLAMALVDAVPAGVYGRQALEALGAWAGLAGRVVQADNVRAALMLVARGEAELGLVYRSDLHAEPRVALALGLPARLHDPIRYPAALVKARGRKGSESQAARAFLDYLREDAAQTLFKAHGFIPAQTSAQ